MNAKLFMTLTCMSFLWIGSQIPLYLFGSVLPIIYQDIGGVDRYTWFVIGYLIPNAALCPFVGALSDLFGRQKVAIVGQVALIIGPIITATAHTMNVAIGKGDVQARRMVANKNHQPVMFFQELAPVSTNSSHSRVPVKLFLSRIAASMLAWLYSQSYRSVRRYCTLR